MDITADEALKSKLGISYSQFLILFFLHQYKDMNQKKIAQFMNFTEAGVSRQMVRLEDLGLLFRHEDPKSKRQNQMSLTQKAEKILTQAYDLLLIEAEKVFGDLKPTQRENLNKTLEILQTTVSTN
jgi:DNA-binding MarR family transcriptional regulator